MLRSGITKTLITVAAVLAVTISFAGCTKESEDGKSYNGNMELVPVQVDSSSNPILTIKPDSVTKPGKTDKRLNPDVSSIELSPASKSAMYSKTEEECIERLRIYSNPNGNEYDALALLGRFKYADKSEDAMMKQLKTASKTWHETVAVQVGEKCIVNFEIVKKTPLDPSDSRVVEWKNANSKEPEAYTNMKCVVSTNYADSELTLSVDLVKLDGKWYLAKTDILNTIKEAITKTLFN